MIGRWIKVFGALRPWMVAVALAVVAVAGCSKGGAASKADAAGAPGGGASDSCEPTTVYGPPPCTKDEDCRGPGGEDWICNPEPMKFDDGCGREVEWGRVCSPGPAAGAPATGAAPGARTDLPPPLPTRDVGPSEE